MEDKKIAMQDIIELLEDPIDLIRTITTDPIEIEHIMKYALYEYLYPPKRLLKDRIIKSNISITDDRPCDTEAPTNVVSVDFSND